MDSDGDFNRTVYDSWPTNVKIAFMEKLSAPESASKLTKARLEKIETVFEFSKTKNSEILMCWCKAALKCKEYFPAIKDVAIDFAKSIGRMKFCRPLWSRIAENDLELATSLFEAHKSFYHPIAQKMVAADLEKIRAGKAGVGDA